MTNFQTIQKLVKDGYKIIYIDVNEFNSTIRPIDKIDKDINLDDFLI